MKRKSIIFLLGLCLVFLSFPMCSQAEEDPIPENIARIIEALDLIPQLTEEQTKEYLLLICDSILALAPRADVPESVQTQMKTMREAYVNEEVVILQEESVKPLWEAARSIDPDFALNFPENPTPDLIKEDVRQELNEALLIYDEGNVKKTEEILLRTLLRIVTPHRQN